MADICYQCSSEGFLLGSLDCYGLLPFGCTRVKPNKEKAGFVQRFDEKTEKWSYVENHKGEHGYLDGKPFEITEFGPYPKGFSTEAPEPTVEELSERVRNERDAKLNASDKYLMPDFPGMTDAKRAAVLAYRTALREVPKQSGFPKDVKWPSDPMAK